MNDLAGALLVAAVIFGLVAIAIYASWTVIAIVGIGLVAGLVWLYRTT